MYLGSHKLMLDGKSRLSIPYTFRRNFNEQRDGHSIYIVPGRRPRTLALYQENVYNALRRAEPDNESLSDSAYEFRMFESGNTVLTDPDDQGRILLPQWLLERIEMGKEVTLVGMENHLVLWRRNDYEEFCRDMWPRVREQRAAVREEMRAIASREARRATMTPEKEPAAQD
ncbi:MAG: hypothetical protein AB1716_17935 [Planctomycetota bacterium]